MPLANAIGNSPVFGPAALAYTQKVLATQPGNLIAYWPLWERSGSTADNLQGVSARDGSYTGVTLADDCEGGFATCAPLWDGSNDYANIYSSSFNDAFDPALFTISLWLRVAEAGVWTDGTTRLLLYIAADGNNRIRVIRQGPVDNRIDVLYQAGGTSDTVTLTGLSTTDWFNILFTVSAAADEMKVYRDGAQVGSTQTGLGTWVGDIAGGACLLGALSQTPSQVWHGHLAHVPIWTDVLTSPQITTVATV